MIASDADERIAFKSSLPLVEIVSHCYAAELPQYAAMLVYQASSLVIYKPKLCRVRLTVCAWPEDPYLPKVLEWARATLSAAGVLWKIISMTRGEIGRRCIGRNRAALDTDADIVWFADVDYVFREGVLDRLTSLRWPEEVVIIYPREVMISIDHAAGDRLVRKVNLRRPRLADVDPSQFVRMRYTRAIGGAQIVRGGFARRHGYLAGDGGWQAPAEKPFSDTRDDVAYRRRCAMLGRMEGVDLPGIFRIRHSRTSYR